MSSISGTSGAVYLPCYYLDLSSRTITFGKYNYTEMVEKMKSARAKEGVTYWEPDEYGQTSVDPEHPRQAALESGNAAGIFLPSSGFSGLPSGGRAEQKINEEQKAREERLRMFREEREQTARREALLHRLTQTVLLLERS